MHMAQKFWAKKKTEITDGSWVEKSVSPAGS